MLLSRNTEQKSLADQCSCDAIWRFVALHFIRALLSLSVETRLGARIRHCRFLMPLTAADCVALLPKPLRWRTNVHPYQLRRIRQKIGLRSVTVFICLATAYWLFKAGAYRRLNSGGGVSARITMAYTMANAVQCARNLGAGIHDRAAVCKYQHCCCCPNNCIGLAVEPSYLCSTILPRRWSNVQSS